jgi:hypothetical protein
LKIGLDDPGCQENDLPSDTFLLDRLFDQYEPSVELGLSYYSVVGRHLVQIIAGGVFLVLRDASQCMDELSISTDGLHRSQVEFFGSLMPRITAADPLYIGATMMSNLLARSFGSSSAETRSVSTENITQGSRHKPQAHSAMQHPTHLQTSSQSNPHTVHPSPHDSQQPVVYPESLQQSVSAGSSTPAWQDPSYEAPPRPVIQPPSPSQMNPAMRSATHPRACHPPTPPTVVGRPPRSGQQPVKWSQGWSQGTPLINPSYQATHDPRSRPNEQRSRGLASVNSHRRFLYVANPGSDSNDSDDEHGGWSQSPIENKGGDRPYGVPSRRASSQSGGSHQGSTSESDVSSFPNGIGVGDQSSNAAGSGSASGAPRKNKMHRCPLCDKLFPRPSGLATHMNSHSGAKRASTAAGKIH